MMKSLKNILNPLQRKKGSRSINSNYIEVDRTPTPSEEQRGFDDPELLFSLKNYDYAQDIELKQRFAKMSFRTVGIWLTLLIVTTFLQGTRGDITIKINDSTLIYIPPFLLDQWAFVAVFTTTTASVFAISNIVGKYLFKSKADE